jgi:hypothetical protein
MKVCWFSAGVSSFIAGWLERDTIDEFIYTHIDDQHLDTLRFIEDCEGSLCRKVNKLQSRYKSVGNVIKAKRFINSAHGAACTEILKKRVRKEWEHGKKDLVYVWGYDLSEKDRAENIEEAMPQHRHIFPLIERGLYKEDCHGMLKKMNIKRPYMYDLGYRNNNCIGCVKGGMGYWNKIRIDFPKVFAERARQEREIGHSCLKEQIDGKTVPLYLDELDPCRGNIESEIMEDCGIYCQLNS